MRTCKRGHEIADEKKSCNECRREDYNKRYKEDAVFRTKEQQRAREKNRRPEVRAKMNARVRERRATDKEFAERLRVKERERYANNPVVRAKARERFRKRYTEDAVFREGVLRRQAERRARIMADPVLLADRRELWRFYAYDARRRAGIPMRVMASRDVGGIGKVDSGLFIEWLDDWLARFPSDTEAILAERAGSSARSVRRWRDGEQIGLGTVDRFLVAAGEPWVIDELYPLEQDVAA